MGMAMDGSIKWLGDSYNYKKWGFKGGRCPLYAALLRRGFPPMCAFFDFKENAMLSMMYDAVSGRF